MSSEKFRRQLRQESEKWWSEGLIDATLYTKLSERYQFDGLEREASGLFITILMGLGAILLGLGAITFVAANWQEWPRLFKVVLLLGCFVGVNATGFYLWRKPTSQKGQQRLGHGLLLLGALLLGANMALMSQMFHQSGEFYQLCLVWGLGVAAMAYSLRLTSLGILALVLVALGYTSSWFSQQAWNDLSGPALVVQHLPLVVSLVFVPLAYWCRSRVIFGFSAIAIAVSLVYNIRPWMVWNVGSLLALAFVLPPALLWSYSDRLWYRLTALPRSNPQFPNSSSSTFPLSVPDPFQSISRSLAILFLSILFYVFAFHWWWEANPNPGYFWLNDWNGYILVDFVGLAVLTGLGWLQLRHQFRLRQFQERAINTGTIALLLLITAGLLIGHRELVVFPAIATVVFNVMLSLLAMGLIRDGLAHTQRHTFWGGMVLLMLTIISRMLEYNTGLVLKSIVFVLCGIGVIVAGLWFERNVHPQKVVSQPPSSQEELP